MKPEHVFKGTGFLCQRCMLTREGHRAARERVSSRHLSVGDPCEKCGKPASKHPTRETIESKKAADRERKDRSTERYIVGVDGEGHDLPDGTHIYTYLAAVSEDGRVVSEARNPNGLTHAECMEMLLRIPQNTLKFAFSFNYDITMMIRELPNVDKYYLIRPELRREYRCTNCKHCWRVSYGRICPKCDEVKTGRSHMVRLAIRPYRYDYFNGTLTISRGKESCRIWDCFKFFATSFVEAITDWDVGTPDQRDRIAKMKAKRGSFSEESPEEIEKYCQEECELLAKMMRKLKDAHDKAGLELTQYYGAGSTASALLKKHKVADFRGPKLSDQPKELADAIMSAFFGGRFENSVVGEVRLPVHGYDIASAYPYAQATALPCLKCGKWRKARKSHLLLDIKHATLALCKFKVKLVDEKTRSKIAWMPLPFRDEKGSICYPTGFEGWAWRPEALSALEGWSEYVELTDAWLYHTKCDHEPWHYIPETYLVRIGWGKDGAGKVLKLGMNAGYGKNAQHLGGEDAPYREMVWAGMTTSTCRAQGLDAIRCAKNRWSVLSIATDGIYSTEELNLPSPTDTGTTNPKKPPLGAWEYKFTPEGIFLVKPGVYFRLSPESVKDNVKARGVGRKEVYEQRERLIVGFNKWDKKDFKYHVPVKGRRFYGAKHSINAYSKCIACDVGWPGVPERMCPKCGKLGDDFKTSLLKTTDGDVAYGRWCERVSKISFDPRPKREGVMSRNRLRIRDVGGATSRPFKGGQTTPEGEASRETKEFMMEQPDIEPDWSEGKGDE